MLQNLEKPETWARHRVSVRLFAARLADWLPAWLAGWLAGWWLAGSLAAGSLTCWQTASSLGCNVQVSRFLGFLRACLPGWLASWLAQRPGSGF